MAPTETMSWQDYFDAVLHEPQARVDTPAQHQHRQPAPGGTSVYPGQWPASGNGSAYHPAGANGRVTQAEVDALEDGLGQTLQAIELNLAQQVFKETFPLVGQGFWLAWSNQVAAFRYLSTLRGAVVAGLSNLTGNADYSTTVVANSINTRLTSAGFNAGSRVLVTTVNDQAQLAFTTLDTFAAGVPIAEDFGLPTLALSLLTETNCRTAVSVSFNFTAGVDGSGFYLETPGSFSFNTTSTINDLNTSARFARLPYTLTDVTTNRTSVPLNINIRVQDPNFSGQLRLNELGGSPDLIEANVTGNTRMSFSLESSLPPSALMPQVGANFELRWSFVDAAVNVADDNATFGNKPDWNLRNNRIHLHSFFNAFARKALDEIEDTTEPLVPLIDILTTEIPLLSDLGSEAVTVLDILGYDPDSVAAIGGLLDLAELADLASSYSENQNVFVDMGDYSLQVGDPRMDHLDDIPGALIRPPSTRLDPDLADFKNNAAGISGLSFPILESGDVTAKILLGRTGTLFAWNSGVFAIEEQFSQFFPVLGPVGVTLGGRVALRTQFGFGYDTQGVFDFYDAGSNRPELLLNGFYALAEDDQGNPVTGITLEAGVTAGIEANIVVASAGVEGDVTATIGMYLDGNLGLGDGKVRGHTLAATPLSEWFYAAGSLSAGLRAYLEVGWPPFGYSFEFDSPRVVLISFDSQDNVVPILANVDPSDNTRLLLNVGDRAPRRVFGDIEDRAEEFVLQVAWDGKLEVVAFNETNSFAAPARIVGHANERGDVLSATPDLIVPVVFTGGPGRDELTGGAGDDELDGGDGPDRLIGNGGDDTLLGGAENDELRGGAGNNILNGGDGLDTASWRGALTPVLIDLRVPLFGGAAANDTLISIERYEGSDWPDIIDGSEGMDQLLAGAGGNDTINGHGSADMIEGGAGDDTLNGGTGDDLLAGGSGADAMDGGAGLDTVSYLGAYAPVTVSLLTGTGTRGDANGDTLVHFEMLVGAGLPKTEGSVLSSGDVLEGSDGADTIYGMDGADTIHGAGGNDLIYGNHPDSPESMKAGYDADTINGGAGNDVIYGQGDDDALDGGAGMDTVHGESGNDHLLTFDLGSPDALDGGAGTNRLSGDYSDHNLPMAFVVGTNNSLTFPGGEQFLNMQTLGTLVAGTSHDVIRLADREEHEYWNKTIDGGGGDDLIIADWRGVYPIGQTPQRTSDSLHGGAGNDTISFEQSIGGVNVNLGSGGLSGAATGMTMSGFENIIGSDHIDTLTGDTNDNFFYPLRGFPGAPQQGSVAFDRIYGGDGADTLVIDYSQLPEANLLGLRMDANYCSCDEVLRLGPGGQPLHAYRYVEAFHIIGSQANDVLYGEGVATTGQTVEMFKDRFLGLGGNDYIEGRFGDDWLDGGPGDDTLEAGTGNDVVIGGDGNDVIHFDYADNLFSRFGVDSVDAGPGDDFVMNLQDATPSSVPGIHARAGDVFRADGGPGSDTLNADFSNQSTPILFNQASPTDVDFPDGAYIRGFEYWRYFVAGNGNDVIVFTGRQSNRIQMHGGDDIINPGLGIDFVSGGLGNDLLIIDYSVGDDANVGGLVSVSANVHQRSDLNTGTVLDRVTVTTGGNSAYTMERYHITGTTKVDDIIGSSGPDILLGGHGNDLIDASMGNDLVDGGSGADTMHGDLGNDILVVDDPGDVVTEDPGQGTDTVRAGVNFTLPVNCELLVLTGSATNGTGNSVSNLINGNNLNNYLRGEGGNDRLNGGGGPGETDRFNGGANADTFVLGDPGVIFYDDGNPATPGYNGYAVIEDFTPSQSDRLRLAGHAAHYFLGASPIGGVPGSGLFHDSNGNAALDPTDELIAILVSSEVLTIANTLANATYTQAVDPGIVGLTPLKPVLFDDGYALRFALEFSIFELMPDGVVLEIQSSSDIGFTDPWQAIASKNGSGTWGGAATVTASAPANGSVTVTVSDLLPLAQSHQRFFRAKLSQP